jgi:hypothetical protein
MGQGQGQGRGGDRSNQAQTAQRVRGSGQKEVGRRGPGVVAYVPFEDVHSYLLDKRDWPIRVLEVARLRGLLVARTSYSGLDPAPAARPPRRTRVGPSAGQRSLWRLFLVVLLANITSKRCWQQAPAQRLVRSTRGRLFLPSPTVSLSFSQLDALGTRSSSARPLAPPRLRTQP